MVRNEKTWFSSSRLTQKLGVLTISSAAWLGGCTTHHWAHVESSTLPPPPGNKVLHTDRLVIHVTDESNGPQCVAYEKHHPVCFYDIRKAIEQGLVRGLWPSFPTIALGTPKDAGPSDYLLQVDVTLDALPPDDAGPGWSAGVRSRFRLMREGEVLEEQTMASRSRAHFAYGSPLGEAATEVMNATLIHVSSAISQVPESRPDTPQALPRVASRNIEPSKKNKSDPVKTPLRLQSSATKAKSDPEKL